MPKGYPTDRILKSNKKPDMRRLSPWTIPLAGLLSLGLTGVLANTQGPDPTWVAYYNGLGSGTDAGKAVAVDAAGNSYVTGYGFRRGAEMDFVTAKYDADGRRLWQAGFDGLTHHTDVPSAIALDGAGNVYVAGRSARGSGTSYDYVLLKYSAAGRLLWAKKRPGSPFIQSGGEYTPVHLAVDPAGNAYVSGYAPGGFRTTKYGPFGAELWSDAYGASEEQPMVVPGFSQIALSAVGGLLLAGGISYSPERSDVLVVRYSPSGERVLVLDRLSPNGVHAGAVAVAPEAGGGFSIAGVERQLPGGLADLLVARFTADGTELWSRAYSRDAQSEDVPVALARDAGGDLVVTGSTQQPGQSGSADLITLKYDSDGTLQWTSAYDGPLRGEDRARVLGLDANGLIYVGATVDGGEALNPNYALLKLSPAGDLLSAACYDGPAGAVDDVAGMAVDGEGNATLTGISAVSGNPVRGYNYGIGTVRYAGDAANAPTLLSVGLAGQQVRGKKAVQGLIRLTGEATTPTVVQLQSSHPEALPVPVAGVAVRKGRATALFTLHSKRVTEPTEVTITATLAGVSKETVITVRP